MAKTVVVGMSGGVDSSVAAWLLQRQGYEVIGATMKLWEEETRDSRCCGIDDVRDAQAVCQKKSRRPRHLCCWAGNQPGGPCFCWRRDCSA